MSRRSAISLAGLLAALVVAAPAAPASAAQVTENLAFTTSDGVKLAAKVGGEGSLDPRPVIVEFSPYAPGCCPEYAGPDYNYLEVHIRGTGESEGAFDALGPRTQQDVVEVLRWACHQPWSNGRLGLYGFSASAITVYNSLHLKLPCVKAAVLGAGTHELYRDLLYPGGIPNLAPGLFVLGAISGLTIFSGGSRLQSNPASSLDAFAGLFNAGISFLQHPTLDQWWRERGMRGDVNHIPILMVTGFFDVEPRGPFQIFQELHGAGDDDRLLVIGAHDGVPAGTTAAAEEQNRWYDHYLGGERNGIARERPVQLWLADGDREKYLGGDFVTRKAGNWPLPRTRWTPLRLSAKRSGSSSSPNDGMLAPQVSEPASTSSYLSVPSLPTATDPHTTAVALGFGAGPLSGNALARAFPLLVDMTLVEPLGLSYTTEPLAEDVLSAGPASLELRLASTAPETDIYAVVSDVWPDGSAHPVATGRLRSSYPEIDESRSLRDPRSGAIVQPYGRYDQRSPAKPGEERLYHVELWPIGNRFQAGHRVRLTIAGVSAYHLPALPALNSVRVGGGTDGSRLLLPVLPGSNLRRALP